MHGRLGIKDWTKHGLNIETKWSQSGPGGRQGVFENTQTYEHSQKLKRKRKHTNEKKTNCFLSAAISSKIGGLNGLALPMFYENK